MQSHFRAVDGPNLPPSCNTGVNSPVLSQASPPWGLDWLRLSFPENQVDHVTEWLTKDGLHPTPSKGKHGYSRGYAFREDPLSKSDSGVYIWWGGDAMQGRATLEIGGSMSERVFLAVSRLSVAFSVRRLDLRLDFDDVSFLHGQDAIVNVLENWPYRGIRPKCHKIDDMGEGTGCTLYVGDRKGPCVIRWYQKGLQMRDPLRPNWCRFEIELKPKTTEQGIVAWDWLRHGQRDELARTGFSAAFLPYFTGSELADKCIIPPEQRVRDFEGRIDVMVTQYGGLIGEMLHRADGDWHGVADMLMEAMERKRMAYAAARAAANAKGDFLDTEIPY